MSKHADLRSVTFELLTVSQKLLVETATVHASWRLRRQDDADYDEEMIEQSWHRVRRSWDLLTRTARQVRNATVVR